MKHLLTTAAAAFALAAAPLFPAFAKSGADGSKERPLDRNVRMATVVGLVGAGGIGQELKGRYTCTTIRTSERSCWRSS